MELEDQQTPGDIQVVEDRAYTLTLHGQKRLKQEDQEKKKQKQLNIS